MVEEIVLESPNDISQQLETRVEWLTKYVNSITTLLNEMIVDATKLFDKISTAKTSTKRKYYQNKFNVKKQAIVDGTIGLQQASTTLQKARAALEQILKEESTGDAAIPSIES